MLNDRPESSPAPEEKELFFNYNYTKTELEQDPAFQNISEQSFKKPVINEQKTRQDLGRCSVIVFHTPDGKSIPYDTEEERKLNCDSETRGKMRLEWLENQIRMNYKGSEEDIQRYISYIKGCAHQDGFLFMAHNFARELMTTNFIMYNQDFEDTQTKKNSKVKSESHFYVTSENNLEYKEICHLPRGFTKIDAQTGNVSDTYEFDSSIATVSVVTSITIDKNRAIQNKITQANVKAKNESARQIFGDKRDKTWFGIPIDVINALIREKNDPGSIVDARVNAVENKALYFLLDPDSPDKLMEILRDSVPKLNLLSWSFSWLVKPSVGATKNDIENLNQLYLLCYQLKFDESLKLGSPDDDAINKLCVLKGYLLQLKDNSINQMNAMCVHMLDVINQVFPAANLTAIQGQQLNNEKYCRDLYLNNLAIFKSYQETQDSMVMKKK